VKIAEANVAYDVALDIDRNVYWTDRPAGTVSKMSIYADDPEVIVSELNQPISVAVGEQGIYYTEWGNGIGGVDFENETLFDTATNGGAWALTVGGGNIYWSLYDLGTAWTRPEGVNGGTSQILGGQSALGSLAYAGDDAIVVWGTAGGTVGAVFNMPEVLASGLGAIGEIQVHESHAYFTATAQGTVNKILVGDGENPVIPLVTEQDYPWGLVVCGGWIFWGNQGSGEIVGAELEVYEPFVRAEGQSGVQGMDCDGGHLVWVRAEQGGGVWALTI
jgi:hypothetical protein